MSRWSASRARFCTRSSIWNTGHRRRHRTAEHRIGRRGEGGDQRPHQRHRAGAPRALIFLDRAAPRTIWPLSCVALRYRSPRRARSGCRPGRRSARCRGRSALRAKMRCRWFPAPRRIGEAEVETLVAPRHRGAGRQHHAAAMIQQVDQIVERVAAGQTLHGARHGEAGSGAIIGLRRQRKTVLFM